MPFRHGRGTGLLLGDEDVARFFREAGVNRGVDLAETSAFGTFDKTFVVGMREGRFPLAGMFAGDADEITQQLDALLGQETPEPMTYGPEGFAFGRRTYHATIEETTHEVSSPYNDMVAATAEMVSTGGVFPGVSFHDLLVGETANGNSASVDNGASSAFGASAVFHVPTNTRNGATVGKIQHSVDDSVWVDLITFTSVPATTTTAEILSVAGTVNRYLRGLWTIAGATGSVFFHLSAARKTS